jgi:ABC-2 type transport system ATP-binding protein
MHDGKLAALGTIAELKSVFVERPILEVRGADPVGLMAWLDKSPLIEKTSLFGTAVHAVLKTGATPVEQLSRALADAGRTVESVTPDVPSLEDVFLDVVDRLARGAAA